MLESMAGKIETLSGCYETDAWGVTSQPAFWNQAIVLSTPLLPDQLLTVIHQIEQVLGRQRDQRWGARTLDIDILYFGNQVITTERLSVPHPEIANRRFTLVPLVEIAPGFVHPLLLKTNLELLELCSDPLAVRPV
jgi:2-amino-4-hydroxy-6-hydroxymethyldihydropteridine diphosphokinase